MRSAWVFSFLAIAAAASCAPKTAPAVATAATPTAAPVATEILDERTDAERALAPRTPVPVATASMADAAPTPRAGSGSGVPVETVIWTSEVALDVDPYKIQSKDGVLKKNKPPAVADDGQQRFYPFAIDYWGLKGTKLETLLGPHVGKSIRVKGEYRKIYDQGKWVYEVDPVSITLLPTQ